MERTTMNTMGAVCAAERRPAATASLNTTNANSPPGAMYSPDRAAAITERLLGFPRSIMIPSLPKMSAANEPRTVAQFRKNTENCMSMPTDMKKRPIKSPLNGLMSLSTYNSSGSQLSVQPPSLLKHFIQSNTFLFGEDGTRSANQGRG
jgi:hypothetical protein